MRLFFALWPPRAAAEALHEWAARVRSGGRVTRVETIHLTLAFLGEVDAGRPSILRNLRMKGEKHSLPIDQARYWKRNDIVWVGPRSIPQGLAALAADLKTFLRANQFRVEEREFAAHVTLIRKARDPGALPELPPVQWPIDEFVLVRSRVSSAGPSYDVLQRYPLS